MSFYVVHDPNGIARLDDNYTIYGFVFSGMEVVDQIVAVETDESDEPLETINLDIKMVNMTRAQIEAGRISHSGLRAIRMRPTRS